MASGRDSSSDSGSLDPYSQLGIEPGAGFEDVQRARDQKLLEVGDDTKARAKIEASYDALLMVSLKERQLGKVSNAAVSASQREDGKSEVGVGSVFGGSLLTRLRGGNSENVVQSGNSLWPDLSLPEGQGLMIRVSLGILALVLLLVSPKGSSELILSLSTIGLLISQVRRGRRLLASLGWSVVLLSIGLILGGILIKGVQVGPDIMTPFSLDQLEALPAIIILWLGSLLLA